MGLAQAILHDPEVLILDEPTDGLDPNQKHQVRQLIRGMAKDKVIILSTHILEEVELVCTRAIIIAGGRMCFDGTPKELRRQSHFYNAVSLTLRDETAKGASEALERLEGVTSVECHREEEGLTNYVIFPKDGRSLVQSVADLAHDRSWEIEHLHVEGGRLDDVFRKITGGHCPSPPEPKPASSETPVAIGSESA